MMRKNNSWKSMALILSGFFALILGLFVNSTNRFVLGAIIVMIGFALYFLQIYFVTERNWLDVRAVFSGVWIVTIGLATMRLNDYQRQWSAKTWILLAVAYLVYQVGATIGIANGEKVYHRLDSLALKIRLRRVYFKYKEERLFAVCVTITLIGLVCFLCNVAVKGFIPAFSSSVTAYLDFYTRFHTFAVASTAVSGLCYYCLKTQTLSVKKRVILWGCIAYLVILFPVLVVSRGTFVVAAVSLTTTIFYLNKRKFRIFVLCLTVIMGVYLFASSLRGYSDEYLDEHFEPSDVNSIVLSPKMAFLYGYLTVSHDNFNEAVENAREYTYGVRQFAPFNVILRLPILNEIQEEGEWYQVRPHLNTVNMLGVFYYDFHEWGVVFCTFLWAVVFGIMQGFYRKSKGPFSLQVLGYAMNPVTLSFFASWVDMFELWMFWGVIFIAAVAVRIRISNKEE